MDKAPFYYTVNIGTKPIYTAPADLFPSEAYYIQGVFRLPLLDKKRERITFRKVPSPQLPIRKPSEYINYTIMGCEKISTSSDTGVHEINGELEDITSSVTRGHIYMRESVYNALSESMYLNSHVEDGGYIIGLPFRQADSSEKDDNHWLIEITDVIQAKGAWGSAGSLLFTGESWSNITRLLDKEYPKKKLLGWFHTHLFEATDHFGLSGMDQELHRNFFNKTWQIAVLINIGSDGKRKIRCFKRADAGYLIESIFYVLKGV